MSDLGIESGISCLCLRPSFIGYNNVGDLACCHRSVRITQPRLAYLLRTFRYQYLCLNHSRTTGVILCSESYVILSYCRQLQIINLRTVSEKNNFSKPRKRNQNLMLRCSTCNHKTKEVLLDVLNAFHYGSIGMEKVESETFSMMRRLCLSVCHGRFSQLLLVFFFS